jgi:hypothetical protein
MKLPITKARLVTTVLVSLNMCAVGLLINRAWHGTQTVELLTTAPKPFATPDLDIQSPASTVNLASIQDQALFYASRNFYTPPPPSALPATPPKPDYKLVGTFIIPSKPTVALLTNSSGTSRKVKTGDNLDGWSVQAIEGGRVILQYETTTFEISSVGKGANAGMQVVPLARTAQVAPVSGVRTLGGGSAMQGASVSRAGYVNPNSSPRLYRPPPK